jgi:hypothetical protein
MPRYGFDATRAVIGHALFNFCRPGLLNLGSGGLLKAFQKEARQFGAILRRQLRRSLIEISDGSAHLHILAQETSTGLDRAAISAHVLNRRTEAFRMPPVICIVSRSSALVVAHTDFRID